MELDIQVIQTQHPKQKPEDESSLGFGRLFTDHMFLVEYTEGRGWHDARIQPYGPLSIDPASPVLHYSQEIFEGLKVYRRADGGLQMFRPMENANRMNQSADRMCMPPLDPEFQVRAMKTLVELERDWVPHSEGTSLYLRPGYDRRRRGAGRPSGPSLPVLHHLLPVGLLLQKRHGSRPDLH